VILQRERELFWPRFVGRLLSARRGAWQAQVSSVSTTTRTNTPGPFGPNLRAANPCYIVPMEVKVKISEEIAARAKARGLRVEAYIEEILAQQLGAQPVSNGRPQTPAGIRAWLDSLAQFSDKIPPLPQTISREWIYQEHD